MKRRDFLKSTLPAAALLQTGLENSLSKAHEPEREANGESAYDLVVIGGSLAGCFAARQAARKGLTVLLVEPRTFLATEITATLRPWLRREGLAEFDRELRDLFLPEQERDEVNVPGDVSDPSSIFGDEIPLFMGTVKKQFMQFLLHENVDVLVGTEVWGVLAGERQESAAGLALASKFGLHAVRCRQILDTRVPEIDASSQAVRPVSYCVELYGVAAAAGTDVSVPRALGSFDDRVRLHRGKCKPGQCFAEFRFVPTTEDVEHEARERTEHLFAHLIRNEAAFAKASIQQMAWETTPLLDGATLKGERPYSNYIHPQPAADFDLSCHDVLLARQTAADLVTSISSAPDNAPEPTFIDCATGRIPLDDCQSATAEDSGLCCPIHKLTIRYSRTFRTPCMQMLSLPEAARPARWPP